MKIIKPLSDEHIQAADKIYAQCPKWKMADAALKLLSEQLPGFTQESCLLKSVAINTLYGTQGPVQKQLRATIRRFLRSVRRIFRQLSSVFPRLPSVRPSNW